MNIKNLGGIVAFIVCSVATVVCMVSGVSTGLFGIGAFLAFISLF